MAKMAVKWMDQPEEHDYPAAASYLALLADDDTVAKLVDKLKASPLMHFKAKDILRASRLEVLPIDNVHVAKDVDKVKDGKSLSPVLLIRGHAASGRPLTIADGYHRVCASEHLDENTDIPCHMATVD